MEINTNLIKNQCKKNIENYKYLIEQVDYLLKKEIKKD